MTCAPRMNRLFAADGKCFDVAVDHGFFNEASFLGGIEDLGSAVRAIVAARPDAVQLTPGAARLLQEVAGPKPALVLRTDVANVYGSKLPNHLFSALVDDAVEIALRLDAACVVVNLLQLPDQPELHEACIRNVATLKPRCEAAGMPLMVEPLVMRPNHTSGGYMVDGDLSKILPLVRQAVELGADVIKADPCDEIAEYHRVVEIACGMPVLVRGGGKTTDEEILGRTFQLMVQGASGIVYGRNVISHRLPAAMVAALMAIVHSGATVAEALAIVQ
ncbi:MAG: class I fructose-bisphosphate aldolase [Fimbriimonadaceae bacterium]